MRVRSRARALGIFGAVGVQLSNVSSGQDSAAGGVEVAEAGIGDETAVAQMASQWRPVSGSSLRRCGLELGQGPGQGCAGE